MQVHAAARTRPGRFPAHLNPQHSPLGLGQLLQGEQRLASQVEGALHDGRVGRASGCRSVALLADHKAVVLLQPKNDAAKLVQDWSK